LIAVIQRVSRASVTTGSQVSEIGEGLLILLGVEKEDGEEEADKLAEKTAHIRIFEDAAGKMNNSLLDRNGSALVVSQFTLPANTERGRRPGFERAAAPDQAERLYERFIARIRALGVPTRTGVFGARMDVELINQGPVTLILQTGGGRASGRNPG